MARKDKKLIVITGGSGLLGLNWGNTIQEEYDVLLLQHNRQTSLHFKSCSINLASPEDLLIKLAELEPVAVVHAAGLTSIEICEKNPELAKKVNVEIAVNVSSVCKKLNIGLIHISTDNLVNGNVPMSNEQDPVDPVNIYAKTKAEAEIQILEKNDNALVVRTNFFGWGPEYRQSFSDQIIQTLKCGRYIYLFEDVFYTPILISELVNTAHELLNQGENGIYQIVGDQRLSKYEFGILVAEIFELDKKLIQPNKLEDMKHLVKRPFDMSMSNSKTCQSLNKKIGDATDHIILLKQQSPHLNEAKQEK